MGCFTALFLIPEPTRSRSKNETPPEPTYDFVFALAHAGDGAGGGPMTADTSETISDITFTIPKEWSERYSGSMVILTPPEDDAQIVVVPIGATASAQDAIAKAWQMFQPVLHASRDDELVSRSPWMVPIGCGIASQV
jgi:hypothetical protein